MISIQLFLIVMNKILIPLEMSHPHDEKKTVLYGAGMAQELGMGLYLTMSLSFTDYHYAFGRSIAEGYPRYNPVELSDRQEKLYYETLKEYKTEIKETLDSAPEVQVNILRNSYPDQISSISEGNSIALIIMCRENILTKFLLPIHRTDIRSLEFDHLPILVHPPEKTFQPVRKILYSTNYHPYDQEVLRKLTDLFEPAQTEITVLHITEDLDFEKKLKQAGYLKLIRTKTKNENIQINTAVTRKKSDISNILRSFATHIEADIIAVMREQKSLLERLLHTGVTDKLAAESELPLMVFSESDGTK
jgi:nucleotide-binding universal stress UspA family protein